MWQGHNFILLILSQEISFHNHLFSWFFNLYLFRNLIRLATLFKGINEFTPFKTAFDFIINC